MSGTENYSTFANNYQQPLLNNQDNSQNQSLDFQVIKLPQELNLEYRRIFVVDDVIIETNDEKGAVVKNIKSAMASSAYSIFYRFLIAGFVSII